MNCWKREKNTHCSLKRGGGNHPAELSVLVDTRPTYENHRVKVLLVGGIDLWKF